MTLRVSKLPWKVSTKLLMVSNKENELHRISTKNASGKLIPFDFLKSDDLFSIFNFTI